MAAMGGADIVVIGQVKTNPDPDGFLAQIDMGKSGDIAESKLLVHALLEHADGVHFFIGAL
jgi:hypothetical protein